MIFTSGLDMLTGRVGILDLEFMQYGSPLMDRYKLTSIFEVEAVMNQWPEKTTESILSQFNHAYQRAYRSIIYGQLFHSLLLDSMIHS